MRIDIRTQCPRCRGVLLAGATYCRACGHVQPDVRLDSADAEPTAREALLPVMPSRPVLTALIGIVAVVLGVSAPVLGIRWAFFGPDDTVRGYFGALADRDADGAWDYVLAQDAERPLTTAPPVLRGAGYTPPSKVDLRDVSTDGDRAQAQVRYEIAGAPVEETLSLRRLGGPDHPFQRWHIENGLHSLRVATAGVAAVLVGDHPVALAGQGGDLPVFPGQYTMRLPEDPLTESDAVTARSAAGVPVGLAPRLRATAVERIDREVKAYLDGCAARAEEAPSGCPFAYGGFYELTSITWRITRYPTLTYELNERGGVNVDTDTAGVIEATGRTTSPSQPTTVERRALSVRGVAAVVTDRVTFTPVR
jgi:hypothetical protein